MSRVLDKVFVRRIRIDAYIGTLDWERLVAQPIEVDIEVEIDNTQLLKTGDLSRGADFGALIAAAREVATEGHIDLVETLADRIALQVLGRLPVQSARVEVRKYSACASAANHVGVQALRTRPSGSGG